MTRESTSNAGPSLQEVQEVQLHALVEQLLFLMWWPKKGPTHPEKNPGDGPGALQQNNILGRPRAQGLELINHHRKATRNFLWPMIQKYYNFRWKTYRSCGYAGAFVRKTYASFSNGSNTYNCTCSFTWIHISKYP